MVEPENSLIDLSEFVVGLSFQDLPYEVRHAARVHVIDTIGCMLAGRAEPSTSIYRELLASWGYGESGGFSICAGTTLPIFQAAALDCYSSRVWDFDNSHDRTGDHPSVAAVPAAFSVTNQRPISGPDLITAVVAAEEVQLRIRLGSGQRNGTGEASHPWTSGTYAPFGASVSVGSLIGLDVVEMASTIGNAFAHCSNTTQSQIDGSMSHRMHHGNATAMGVLSAMAASLGLDGIRRPFNGVFGYYRAFHGEAAAGPELLRDLGSHFEMSAVRSKLYPCCRLAHSVLSGIQGIRSNTSLEIQEIVKVILALPPAAASFLVSDDAIPIGTVAPQFHLPYLAAVSLLEGPPKIHHLLSRTFVEADVLNSLMRKIEVISAPDLTRRGYQSPTCRIRVYGKDGMLVETTSAPPIPEVADVQTKFFENCSTGGLDNSSGIALWDCLYEKMEAQADVGSVVREYCTIN